MPLTMAKIGEENKICRIGGSKDVHQHLIDLGFVVGERVKIVSSIQGNLIVEVKNTRIAMNKALAEKIKICVCANTKESASL